MSLGWGAGLVLLAAFLQALYFVLMKPLIARYGPEFRKIVALINQNGVHVLTPTLKEKTVAWDYNLDFPVDDFERLIFILGHGLGRETYAQRVFFPFGGEMEPLDRPWDQQPWSDGKQPSQGVTP